MSKEPFSYYSGTFVLGTCPFTTEHNDSWEQVDMIPIEEIRKDDEGYVDLLCRDHVISIWWLDGESRDKDSMNFSKCEYPPEGCCFEHSGCGYEFCNEHNPFQMISIKCDFDKLLGKRIKEFVHLRTSTYEHEFAFVLDNKEKVIFNLKNNNPNKIVSLHINVE
ncbi:Hypothetical protein HVR_LOCUS219 [uncultured virus]|nr:Hypothetical protein HVR_LOCUS219 [uncultured virus]